MGNSNLVRRLNTASREHSAEDGMSRSEELERHGDFVKSLVTFTQQHRAANWSGLFADFLEQILPENARGIARTSHQYMWDMLRWQGVEESANGHARYK